MSNSLLSPLRLQALDFFRTAPEDLQSRDALGHVQRGSFSHLRDGFFQKTPHPSRETGSPSSREATPLSRAPRQRRRRSFRCTASSPRADGALGSRADSSRWPYSSSFGCTGVFRAKSISNPQIHLPALSSPIQIHLHLNPVITSPSPLIHLQLAPSSSPIWCA